MWQQVEGKDGYYSVYSLEDGDEGMLALRTMFPESVANYMNIVMFGTGGVHGSYSSIEDVEKSVLHEGEPCSLTFLIIKPRTVTMQYGVCYPETKEDFEFLKGLRKSSKDWFTAYTEDK